MPATLTLLDPTAPAGAGTPLARRTLDGLAGKTVGFIDNAKPNFNFLVDDLAAEFQRAYGVKRIVKRRKRGASIPADAAMLDEVARSCDVVVTGSGD